MYGQINQIQLVMDTVFGKNVLNFSFNFIFFIKMYTKIKRLLSENNRNCEKITIVLGEANLIFYCTESWENYFGSFGRQNNNHKLQDHEFVESGF